MKLRYILIGILSYLLFAKSLFAHPHIAIDTHPVFVFDAETFKGIQVTWVWDELFSEQVIIDYDKNENDKFEPDELKALEQFFHNIKDYKYFSEIKINGQSIDEIKIENFIAKINSEEYTLIYTFIIPVNYKLTNKDVRVSYINNDPTIYVSFSTDCNAGKLDRETKNVDIFESGVRGHSYYGYEFFIVAHKK